MATFAGTLDYEVLRVTTEPRNSRVAPGIERGLSNEDLVARIAGQDQEAMQLFYDRVNGVVFGLIRKILGNPAEAEEVALDAFLQIWKKAGSFNPAQGSATTWTLMIARSRAIDKLRAGRARRSYEEPLEESGNFTSTAPGPEKLAMIGQNASRVRRALEELPPRQREAIELAFFRGLTHCELAAHTGQPLGSAKTHLRLGLINLRHRMQEASL